MENKLTVTSNNSLLIPVEIKNKGYITTLWRDDEGFFLKEVNKIVRLAYLYKGIKNSEDKERAVTATMFADSIKINYPFVSIQEIGDMLKKNNYGVSLGVSAGSLMDCLNNSSLFATNRENGLKLNSALYEEEEKIKNEKKKEEYEKKLKSGELLKEIRLRCNERYKEWKEKGVFVDLFNETYDYITTQLDYEFTEEQISSAGYRVPQLNIKEAKELYFASQLYKKNENNKNAKQVLKFMKDKREYMFKNELVVEFFKTIKNKESDETK